MKGPVLGGPGICRRCTGIGEMHYLTCPTLMLEKGWADRVTWTDWKDEYEMAWLAEQDSPS